MNISRAYELCEGVIKEHSKTFYRAFSILPKPQKNAVWAIYTFCRTVDDIVDESQNPKEQLDLFKKEFDTFLQGQLPSNHFMWIALQDVFNRYTMNIHAFKDMITGQEMDIKEKQYHSMNEILTYSYHVASSVGLMLLPVIAPENEQKLREDAIHLGYAMQLTNILRDIGEDLERGRIYIPDELIKKHHYSVHALIQGEINSSFVAIWEEMATLAESYYEKALTTIDLYPLYSRTPVKGAALLYRAILKEIRKNHYNVFKKRNYVTQDEKNKIMKKLL